jgi:regulator of sirC expression with transglutaminase-like and TPR domain
VSDDPVRRFARLVEAPEEEIRLDEAALLLPTCVRPVDVADGLVRLDDLADGCSARDPDGLSRYLFVENAFRGDTDDYEDPRNSFLDDVLTRRKGIPITLSVLMLEVGRRIDVPLVGVGMPGHFLVRDARDADAFFDPFHGGARIDAAGARSLHAALRGDESFGPELLDPVGPRAILSRMLANLQHSFMSRRPAAVVPVVRMRCAIPGLSRTERHHLATLLGSLGDFEEAGVMLEQLATELTGADADRVRRQAVALRARGN